VQKLSRRGQAETCETAPNRQAGTCVCSAEATPSLSLQRLRLPVDLPAHVPKDLDSIVRFRISNAGSLLESAECLLLLLAGGYSVWEDGRLYEIRVLVERLNGLRITIRTREHGPPHFHVEAAVIDASFAISDCRLLDGVIGGRERRLVEYWYASARPRLVEVWNATRPTDCPVGPSRHEC
jgi:hypothetical protein